MCLSILRICMSINHFIVHMKIYAAFTISALVSQLGKSCVCGINMLHGRQWGMFDSHLNRRLKVKTKSPSSNHHQHYQHHHHGWYCYCPLGLGQIIIIDMGEERVTLSRVLLLLPRHLFAIGRVGYSVWHTYSLSH
jgi:hypothetical protein